MLKVVAIVGTAVALAAIAVAAPSTAQARFGAIADAAAAVPSAQPAQYYGGYRYRPYYAPRYYGGYSDYYRYGYPGSRDSLNTCAYC